MNQMDTSIIVAGISAVSAIFVAYLQMCAARRQKADTAERRARQEETDKWGKRQQELLLMLMREGRATGELTYATAMAVKRGKPNGEIEVALETWNEYDKQFQEYKDILGAERLGA